MTYVTADYESWPIMQRPNFPPKPVGLALWPQGQPEEYLAFGHVAGGNNCTEHDARERLRQMWADPTVTFVFHNAKFDMSVAEEQWELPRLPATRFEDTMILGFLNNPYEPRLALKPLAEKYLSMPPDERDAVAAYVMQHRTQFEQQWVGAGYDVRYGPLKVQKGKEGAWIFAVPGEIVSPYAKGDCTRTGHLFSLLEPVIQKAGMGEAYMREKRLMPILMDNERTGMRVDVELLAHDIEVYGRAFEYVETQLRHHLGASGLNFDADQDVASVLVESGAVPESNFARTASTRTHPNGQYSMSKETLLPELFTGVTRTGATGQQIASALGYRNRLATCLNTFMKPWLAQALRNNGYITTNWSQTREMATGAVTGRAVTSFHNFLNLPKDFAGRDDQYTHPSFLGVPELPLCRRYILPDEGTVFLHRDFKQQEVRIFGHFEQGELWEQYQADPKVNVHAFVGAAFMKAAGREIEETKIKVMNFQSIYGGGAPALSKKLRIPLAEAKVMKKFHEQALPGRKILSDEIVRILRRGDPIRTWGGRLYWPTPNGENGRETFYKVLNYLVQGSAADLTKQSLIDWNDIMNELPPWITPARFMVTVYDEINICAPLDVAHLHMRVLREAMEADRLSVKMLSDGKWGSAWGRVEKYKDEEHWNATT